MKGIYVGLGSNMGDRFLNIQRAFRLMKEAGIVPVKSSSLYETEPVDYKDQDYFYNGVVEVNTVFSPLEVLEKLQHIELVLGRRRLVPFGPRIIDLDLLFYGDDVLNLPELVLPHPRLFQRRFVLVPMVELNPCFEHPLLKKTVRQLLEELHDTSRVFRCDKMVSF